ncbi:unnamed protein product [Rotaria magnacalcarata]|uniref:NAD(P)(+)--arginine ADP-ribosyltransferase n=1 Tax=Rotaria magnacalcarata TaxID=392030 RepID=A0A819XTI0_9BILA|nr:unnamed protein product [Rotaria magnacalcarata]CAF4144495.1 unnamed protein product [Rotaria magnacalcarata]
MVQTIFKGNHSLKTYDDVAILLLQFQDMNTELNEQVDLIPSDHGKKSCHEVDNPWSYYVFNNNTDLEESTTELNGDFIHSQLLINCLLKMELTPMAKKEFISFCQNQTDCKDNKEHATHVNEFEKNYSHNTALLWYTKSSFVYRMLNTALRKQNVDTIYRMRFIIRDLEQQLKELQRSFSEPVYRGQRISTEELNRLKKSKNKLI